MNKRNSIRNKILLIILLMTVSSTVTIGTFSYTLHRQDTVNINAQNARNIAETISAVVDGGRLRETLESGEIDEYWLEKKLYIDDVMARTAVTYLYLLDINHAGGFVTYLMEASLPGETDVLGLGDKEAVDVHAYELFKTIKTGNSSATGVYRAGEYGMMVSGFSALLDEKGVIVGVVGVDINVDDVMDTSRNFGLTILLCVIGFSTLFCLIGNRLMQNSAGKTITELSNLEKILNSLDTMIYVTDPDTDRILFINENMKKHYGIENDCIGQLCYKLLQEGMSKRCDFCPCHRLDNEPGVLVEWEEHSTITGRYYRNSDRYISWPDGRKLHLQHSVDITELIAAKELAEKNDQIKSIFLANISHEIRTPMNAVLGIVEIELNRMENTPEIKNALGRIYDSGYILLGIINDILDLSKIETGKFELLSAKYDLASAILNAVQMNILRLGDKDVEFQLLVSEKLPAHLFGDELRIRQILNNLLSNAFKYTEKGKVTLEINAEPDPAKSDSAILIFTVCDTGQGMTGEQVERIFDDYARFNVEYGQKIEGIGLGMSITKNLTEMMNGTIEIASELGVGSVFTVKLPQQITKPGVIGKAAAENLQNFRFTGEIHESKAMIEREFMSYASVLIVDDVENNLFVAEGLLAPYGIKIETAASGYEALEKIRNGAVYDIIFMDQMMPKMNGIETVKHMRDEGYIQPIVALTANALTGQAELFMANGFDEFLTKPIDIKQLDKLLKIFIRSSGITEINAETGLRLAAGNRKLYEKIIEHFCKNLLPHCETMSAHLDSGDIEAFATSVHGVKSMLSGIGATKLSEIAFELEETARKEEIEYLNNNYPAFLEKVMVLHIKLNECILKSVI